MPNRDESFDVESLSQSLSDNTREAQQALRRLRDHVERLESIRDRSKRLQALLSATETLEGLPLSEDLDLNVKTLEALFGGSSDWVARRVRIAGGRQAAVTYIDGLADKQMLEENVVRPLLYEAFPIHAECDMDDVRYVLENHVIVHTQVKTVESVHDVVDAVLHADAVLLIDGVSEALAVSTQGFKTRAVEEPETEAVVQGPREGFNENLGTSTALLRRRIRTPNLRVDRLRVGRLTRTDIAVVYIQGLAADGLVEEVKSRISGIDIDGIIDSEYIVELIEDDVYSPFPQVLNTERPDIAAANLLEGRVAICVDGSPFCIVVPITLWGMMQASEDYYGRPYIGMFIRLLRYVLAFFALLGPSLYVAILTFHQEMLPTSLLLTVAATREGIPFPSVVEALIMELTFEALREAGVRLPKVVGQAVSIVGALVIGQAAVQAGIVSAPMVIIVASTGIASFTFPRFSLGIAVRLLRFPMIIVASILGLFGIMLGLMAIAIHLVGLRSFGVPYLAPVAPLSLDGLKDVFIREPLWTRKLRPRQVAHTNLRRQEDGIKSGPDPWEGDAESPKAGTNS